MRTLRLGKFRRYMGAAKNPGRFFKREGRRRQRGMLRSILPRGAFRNIRMANRLFRRKGGRRFAEPEETRISAGLEEAPEENIPSTGPRRGPATLYERRMRLEEVVRTETENDEKLEFQANTIAIIRPANPLLRLLKLLIGLLLLPLLLLKSLFGSGKPAGKGKMGKRLVTVDRRGRVQVRKI